MASVLKARERRVPCQKKSSSICCNAHSSIVSGSKLLQQVAVFSELDLGDQSGFVAQSLGGPEYDVRLGERRSIGGGNCQGPAVPAAVGIRHSGRVWRRRPAPDVMAAVAGSCFATAEVAAAISSDDMGKKKIVHAQGKAQGGLGLEKSAYFPKSRRPPAVIGIFLQIIAVAQIKTDTTV